MVRFNCSHSALLRAFCVHWPHVIERTRVHCSIRPQMSSLVLVYAARTDFHIV